MKKPFFLCLMLISAVTGFAEEIQSPQDATTQEEAMAIRRRFVELSKEASKQPEIQKLKAQADEAMTTYRKALEAEITKQDAEIVGKYQALMEDVRERMKMPGAAKSSRTSSGFDSLTEDEKKKLFAARQKAVDTPEVAAARQKRNTAKTEEERKTAEKEYKDALHQAMLDTDKDLKGLLDKLEAGGPPAPRSTPASK